MNTLFVPYELAVKLKEKGFDEQCLMVYESKDSMIPESEAGINKTNVDAPLYQQVLDWLLKKLNDCPPPFMFSLQIFSDHSGRWIHHIDNRSENLEYDFNDLIGAITEALKLI